MFTLQRFLTIRALEFQSFSPIGKVIRVTKYGLFGLVLVNALLDIQANWAGLQAILDGEPQAFALFIDDHVFKLTILVITIFLIVIDYIYLQRSKFSADDYRNKAAGQKLLNEMRAVYAKVDETFVNYDSVGAGVFNGELNHYLLDASLNGKKISVNILPDEMIAYDKRAKNQDRLLRFVIAQKICSGASISNGRKIRMASDLISASNYPINLQSTDYFSSLITDQIAFIRITDSRPDALVRDGFSHFLRSDAANRTLLDVGHAIKMSNQIGASTLAFSKDGYLMLVWQTINNSQSTGLLAPGGSGSLDWEDIGERDDLLAIVSAGAARELVEECGLAEETTKSDLVIDSDEVANDFLKVYGFARMVHRGGKPEFYCVAALPYTANQINSARYDRKERVFSKRTEISDAPRVSFERTAEDVQRDLLKTCQTYSNDATVGAMLGDQFRGRSYPLAQGLDLFADALRGRNGLKIAAFLKRAASYEQSLSAANKVSCTETQRQTVVGAV